MKKILIILSLILVPYFLQAQNYNIRFAETTEGAAALNGLDSVFIEPPYANRQDLGSAMAEHMGVYNIKDYGATDGGTVEDQTAINAAIDAAYDVGTHGGKVVIPPGEWYITDPIYLRSYVQIDAEGAYITVAMDTTEALFQNKPGEPLYDCYVTGGYYKANYSCNFLNLISTDITADYIMMNRFENMHIYRFDICFNLENQNYGWVNSNIFDNITMMQCVEMLKTRAEYVVSGMSGNIFNNLVFNAREDYTTFGIDSLAGYGNVFNNLNLWDFNNNTFGDQYAIVLSDDAAYTQINGSYLPITNIVEDIVDNGWNNKIMMLGNTTLGATPILRITALVAGTGITKEMLNPIILYDAPYAIDITVNPQIVAGYDGQQIIIISEDDTDTLTLDDGNGLQLAGGASFVMGTGDTITLVYSAFMGRWIETSRSNN